MIPERTSLSDVITSVLFYPEEYKNTVNEADINAIEPRSWLLTLLVSVSYSLSFAYSSSKVSEVSFTLLFVSIILNFFFFNWMPKFFGLIIDYKIAKSDQLVRKSDLIFFCKVSTIIFLLALPFTIIFSYIFKSYTTIHLYSSILTIGFYFYFLFRGIEKIYDIHSYIARKAVVSAFFQSIIIPLFLFLYILFQLAIISGG